MHASTLRALEQHPHSVAVFSAHRSEATAKRSALKLAKRNRTTLYVSELEFFDRQTRDWKSSPWIVWGGVVEHWSDPERWGAIGTISSKYIPKPLDLRTVVYE
jgi:hypothetical protein